MRRPRPLRNLGGMLRDDRAVAAVEFALILPLLLTLYLGTVEGASLYAVDRKVATLASTVADLVAREKDTLTQTELDDYFEAAVNILSPYDTDGLAQVVSLLSIDSAGEATVVWSAAHGSGVARDADDQFPLEADAEINVLARGAGGWLVVGEADYAYSPLTGFVYQNTINLRHVEYFLPRIASEVDYDPNS